MKLSPIGALKGLALAACALLSSSCVYDAYYSSGYGYGGGGYSSYGGYGSYNTSVFVTTSSPYWAYDPYRCLYFDRRRSCYYDPYLYGYYPRGYIPAYVYGCPHPYGWRPGYGTLRPPSRIHDHYLSSYRDRGDLYRRNNFSWSRNFRESNQRFDGNRGDGNRRDGRWDNDRRDGRSSWNEPRRDGDRTSGPRPSWRDGSTTDRSRLITQPSPSYRPQQGGWSGGRGGNEGGSYQPRSSSSEPRVRQGSWQGGSSRPSYNSPSRGGGEVRQSPSRPQTQPRSSGGSNRGGSSQGGSTRESREKSVREAAIRSFR